MRTTSRIDHDAFVPVADVDHDPQILYMSDGPTVHALRTAQDLLPQHFLEANVQLREARERKDQIVADARQVFEQTVQVAESNFNRDQTAHGDRVRTLGAYSEELQALGTSYSREVEQQRRYIDDRATAVIQLDEAETSFSTAWGNREDIRAKKRTSEADLMEKRVNLEVIDRSFRRRLNDDVPANVTHQDEVQQMAQHLGGNVEDMGVVQQSSGRRALRKPFNEAKAHEANALEHQIYTIGREISRLDDDVHTTGLQVSALQQRITSIQESIRDADYHIDRHQAAIDEISARVNQILQFLDNGEENEETHLEHEILHDGYAEELTVMEQPVQADVSVVDSEPTFDDILTRATVGDEEEVTLAAGGISRGLFRGTRS